MTTERNIIIHAGQTFTLSLDYAGTAGRGQRMHIRASDAAADVIAILTHNGDANARVIYDGTNSIDITIGASVNGGWLVGANRVEWVYDIEDYDLSDTDDVVIAYRGKAIVYGNRTRPEDVTPSAALPSGDGRYLRIDGDQGLTPEQQAWAQHNSATGPGGPGGAGDHGALTGLSDDDHPQYHNDARGDARYSQLGHTHSYEASGAAAAAIAAHEAALDPHPTYTTAAEAAAAAPVQSVAGRTGAVTLAVADVSGAESTANKAQPSGYASLDSSGKLPQAQLPSIAISEFLGEVANQAAMLALTGQKGDWCIRTDTGATWIITGTDPTLLGSWTAISYPTSAVTSVAGRTGAVTLSTSDVSGLGNVATLDIGTTAGTAAAGDDSRFTAAIDASRLPAPTTTALGGVKRNTGSAGQFVTGIDADGALLRDTPAGGGGSSNIIRIEAGELIPRVTSGAGIAGAETTTNDLNRDVLAFDPSATEGAQKWFRWPAGYTSVLCQSVAWESDTGGTGGAGVRWEISMRCFADGDALDQALGTAQGITDTLDAVGDVMVSGASSAITPAGTVADNALTCVQIVRNPSHGDDGLSVDAWLHDFVLEFSA